MKKLLLAATALSLASVGGVANAAVQIFDLNVSDPSAGLGSGTLGTVTATEVGANLNISVVLSGAEFRYSPDAQHIDFVFQLGNTSYALSNISNPFFEAVSGGTNTPFGSWNYALDCNRGATNSKACQPGWKPGVNPTSLSFTIDNASLADLLSHTYDGKTIWFAADVVTASGATGAVGATRTTPAVPESSTWAMMIAGFGSVGYAMRRRRSVAVSFA
jgi:hypothetical protein